MNEWIEVTGIPTFGEYKERGLPAPAGWLEKCLSDRRYEKTAIPYRAMLEIWVRDLRGIDENAPISSIRAI